MRVRGPAEQAEGSETQRFDISTTLLPSAREAGPRTELHQGVRTSLPLIST